MKNYKVVVIGVSAGGIVTLSKLFAVLKSDFSLPIIVVQHLHPTQNFEHVHVLNNVSPLPVVEAGDKQAYDPGSIYLSPPDYHLQLERNGVFSLSIDEKVNHCRPSVDILFESAVDVFLGEVIGVVLTGANCDGAKGLLQISKAGGLTIVEDPLTAECPYMPKAALELLEADYVLKAEDIGIKLNYLC